MDNEPRESLVTGLKKDRMEALHDGIYAVAKTLLVFDLHVPHGITSFADFLRQLNVELPQFGAGTIAFSVRIRVPMCRRNCAFTSTARLKT